MKKYCFLYFLTTLLLGCTSLQQLQTSNHNKITKPLEIKWYTQFDEASKEAQLKSKPMMLVFYGVSSKRLDERVFADLEVLRLADNFVCLRLGSDQNELTKRYLIQEFPTIVFTDARGLEYDRAIGYKSPSSFVSILKNALSGVEAEYIVAIESPEKKIANIKCVFKNIRSKSLILYLIERHDKINIMSYDSTDGRPGLKKLEDGIWEMQFNTFSMKTITIQYQVEINILSRMDYEPAYISYIDENYGILDGHALFIAPRDLSITGKINIQLKLPPEWDAITPWDVESQFNFSTKRIDEVSDSVLCIGKFQYTKRQINDKEIYIIFCGTDKYSSDLESKGDTAVKIFNDYTSRFGDFPFSKYVAIFAARTPDKKYIHGTAHGSGFAGPIEMGNFYTLQFMAHEIFHVWNGRLINQKSDYEAWFKEGFTQYYGYITPYRAGLYSKEVYLQYLKRDYNEYLRIYENGLDMALTRVNEGIARREGFTQADSIRVWTMYNKGALVAHLVNVTIMELTNGQKNLDDLMNYIFINYRYKSYTTDDILKAVNSITGHDFSKFFADYIYGRAKLPPLIEGDNKR